MSELDGLLAEEAGLSELQHLLKAAVADTLRLGWFLLDGLDIDVNLHAQLVLHFIIVQYKEGKHHSSLHHSARRK